MVFDELTPRFKPILIGLFVASAAFLAGWFLSGQTATYPAEPPAALSGATEGQPAQVDFSIFWQTWAVIDDKFVNGTSTTALTQEDLQNRVYGAAAGLVDSLGDPYTVFFSPADNEAFTDDIRGDFGGVGMELGARDRQLKVITTLPDTPAERAGVRAGDVITQINGKPVGKMTVDEAVKLIRGEVGTTVALTVNRSGEGIKDFEIVRGRIQVPTMETELLPSGVFVLKLYSFNALSPQLFKQGLRQFIKAKTDKLIIDLRGNPGGYLEASVDVASWFLPEGKVVVKERRVIGEDDKLYRSRGYNVFDDKLKLVILIDGGSASASEIVAGALSEHGRAVLIGEKTFGKGSVQELVSLPDGSAVKITIAKWLTPEDHSISENGLKPAIEVDMTAEDREAGRDPQLAAAVDYLLKQ
ncbi:MAG: peptidase S41 [Candidatus Vogelbacteria bacterium CG10_big_fil_rev_8_21_14_0_10_50_13]|uniref:Peptidase S41 n=1 Tax=Candidatus Vogelbacteria bacterium CG10_big_fil_rev_8_21_14_0_10_50_13 TaxID=1975044 RepID=A0A2H0RG55_9BACT|nr:MAG: peptidase S41 [Candidatus Vogelbacteria bacterium CG10_big_fil_rev_8_21_14_0_10_50_13]